MYVPLPKKLLGIALGLVLLTPILQAHASAFDEPTTIALEKPVYFLAPDGSSLVVQKGHYSVEAAQEWIRLIPGKKRNDALLIEAKKETHDVGSEIPIALSIPGDSLEELNLHHIQLLLPNGTSLEATGTYDGVRSRGFLSKAKKRARARAAKARRAAARKAKAAKAAALRAKRDAEQAAHAAAAKAQELARKAKQEAERLAALAAIGTCKAAVKADQMAGALKAAVLQAAEAELAKIKEKFRAIDLIDKAFGELERQGNKVMENLADSVPSLNTPVNLEKLKKLMNPYYLCEGGFRTAPRDIQQMLSRTPAGNLFVGSRGSKRGGTVSIGYQYNQAAIAGVEGGFGVGLHVPNPTPAKGYIFAGGMLTAGAGSSHAIQIGYWPGALPEQLGLQVTNPALKDMPYWALGFSLGSWRGSLFAEEIWPRNKADFF